MPVVALFPVTKSLNEKWNAVGRREEEEVHEIWWSYFKTQKRKGVHNVLAAVTSHFYDTQFIWLTIRATLSVQL